MKRRAPLFYSNSPDEVHCFQASLKMVLSDKAPDLKVGLPELLFITGNSGELTTWPLRAAVYLANAGFDVLFVDPFPLHEFIKAPEQAMRSFYGDETADWQMANSNIPRAVLDAETMLENRHVEVQFAIPNLDDLCRMLAAGYLCICNVNAKTLTSESGYAGHFVVVYDVDLAGRTISLQNPGPPMNKEAEVSFELFERAWACSGDAYKNVLAVKESSRLPSGLPWLEGQLQAYRQFVHGALSGAAPPPEAGGDASSGGDRGSWPGSGSGPPGR
jgi:hypothetical protein